LEHAALCRTASLEEDSSGKAQAKSTEEDFDSEIAVEVRIMEEHEQKVANIAARVRQFHDSKAGFRVYHGSSNSTRTLAFERNKIVDTSCLNKILKIDRKRCRAWVEPNVSMRGLVEATLKEDLLPEVVMEFPEITAGGGFSGPSGESSSFKYGFFENTVCTTEIVLGNGDVVTASPTENSDLFRGAAGSLGTLGVITLLEVRLIEAKKYVRLEFRPVCSMSQATEAIEMAVADSSNDFVDGILLALDRGVVMVGRLTDDKERETQIQTFSAAHDPWFYLYAERLFNWRDPKLRPVFVTIPTTEYLFRYNRGGFWVGRHAFQYFMTPFNRITRWILDSFMHTSVMYRALHESGHAEQYFIQDLAVPKASAQKFVEYLDQELGVYPLWLCPLRQGPSMSLGHSGVSLTDRGGGAKVLSIGLWGPGPTDRNAFFVANRKIEQKLHELGGLKWLYARAYYTEDEFWEMYDRKAYEALRLKYHAASLPTVFDKIKKDRPPEESTAGVWTYVPSFWNIWPISGLYGVYRATLALYTPFGKNYILAK
jgi:Delta24-sterol reductase